MAEMTSEHLLHSELTEKIIGTFYEVYNELGHGFLESVYENSLTIALKEKGLDAQQQVSVPVWFHGQRVGDFYADIIVNDLVILELKAARSIDQAHIAQLLNYLRATEVEVGFLLNFGPKPEFKRQAYSNSRKNLAADLRRQRGSERFNRRSVQLTQDICNSMNVENMLWFYLRHSRSSAAKIFLWLI